MIQIKKIKFAHNLWLIGLVLVSGFVQGATIPVGCETPGTCNALEATFGRLVTRTNLELTDDDDSHYVGFKSPTTVTTNTVWTLPNSDGTNNQVLKTDGAGNLAWVDDQTATAGTDTLTSLNCSHKQIAQWNGTTWVCADNLSTNYTLPTSDGTAGQVLKTDGGGTLSWTTVSGGGTDNDTLGDLNCASSEIVQWNGSAWICASASNTSASFGINVKDYGAVGNGMTDDTAAFNAALTASRTIVGSTGGGENTIFVPKGNYKIASTLELTGGEKIVGETRGWTTLQTPGTGSIICFEGDDSYAFKITGHNVHLESLAIWDCDTANVAADKTSAGAIQLLGDGSVAGKEHIGSTTLRDLYIYGFQETGIQLKAINNGSVFYSWFENIRLRQIKDTAFHISENKTVTYPDTFVNSNTFNRIDISGGVEMQSGIHIEGGNNNNFFASVVEPYHAVLGHINVDDGEIQFLNGRIEAYPDLNAGDNEKNRAVIHFAAGTTNSKITGTYAGGTIIDEGNNNVEAKSGLSIDHRTSSENLLQNPMFYGSSTNDLLDWDISGTGTVSISTPELSPIHNVLTIQVAAGDSIIIQPSADKRYKMNSAYVKQYNEINFGAYIKTAAAHVATTAVNVLDANGNAATNSAKAHIGDNTWQFIGTTGVADKTMDANPRIFINNTTGSSITVSVTKPTLNFGTPLPETDEGDMSQAGGKFYGTVIPGIMSHSVAASNEQITLPHEGNLLFVTGSGSIERINNAILDRFEPGTILTLIFDTTGITVNHSGYLKLKNNTNFVSGDNTALELVALDGGVWQEVSRNE